MQILAAAILIAEGDPIQALAGSSGWAGTGILGAVLGWMFLVHLPSLEKARSSDRDAYLTALRDERASAAVERVAAAAERENVRGERVKERGEWLATITAMQAAHDADNAAERLACANEREKLRADTSAQRADFIGALERIVEPCRLAAEAIVDSNHALAEKIRRRPSDDSGTNIGQQAKGA